MAVDFYDPKPITADDLRSVATVNPCGQPDYARCCRDVAP
jgi:hypothetical protein